MKVGQRIIPLGHIAILLISGIGLGVLAYHIWQTQVMKALFTRPLVHLKTEKSWVEQFSKEIEKCGGN